MRSIRCGLIEGAIQLRILLCRSKTIIIVLTLAVILISYLQPIANVAAELSVTVNPFEPFIMLINSGDSFPSTFFYIYMFFLIMLSDQPLFNHGFRYRIVRMGKTSWWIGQIVTMLGLCIAYILIIYIISILPFLGRTGTIAQWSRYIVSLTKTDMAAQRGIQLIVDASVFRNYSPISALLLSGCYMFAYIMVSGLFVSAFHAQTPSIRPAGIGVLLSIYLYDYIRIYYLPRIMIKYSLAAMARLVTINNGYSLFAPSKAYVNTVWLCLGVIMILWLWFASRYLGNSIQHEKEV